MATIISHDKLKVYLLYYIYMGTMFEKNYSNLLFIKVLLNICRKKGVEHPSELVVSHSWSTVKIDRNGLQFFWQYVLKTDWQWVNIIKAPQVHTLPDILTVNEVEQLILATRQLRYRVFLLVTYSMGLRLSEALSLQVGDIDAQRKLVHIRRGKGHKDRFVPLPDLTYTGLKALWRKHRNPIWLFPSAVGSMERVAQATTHMHRGGAQAAMKAVVTECGIKKNFNSFAAAQLRNTFT